MDFDLICSLRKLTWLPINQLPVSKVELTVGFAQDFTPLMAIVDQIAIGKPPAPHVSMRYELLRFCTLRSYPKDDKPYLIKLAEAGFYYASDGDGVICYCCGIRRYNWTADDQPIKIHKRINPTCKFLIKNEEVNVRNNYNGPFSKELMAIDSIPEAVESQEQTEDVNNDWTPQRTRSPAPRAQDNESMGSSNGLGINTVIPKHSQYATEKSRLASFNGWPDTASHTPEVLTDAGFFYAGYGDCVRCFYCGIGLRHWTQDDNPWIEHARWAKNCAFVKQKKGEEFVNLVQLAVQYSQDNVSEENSAWDQLSPQEIENILLSDAALSVLYMGYQPRIIKKAIEQILRQNRQANITAQFLKEKIIEIEEKINETPGTCVSHEINTANPKHSKYATKKERLDSFVGWPDSAGQSPDKLADAGFFYEGVAGFVRCFYCSIELGPWTQKDNPWVEHAWFANKCAFVKQQKGEEFVNLMIIAEEYQQDQDYPTGNTIESTAQEKGNNAENIIRQNHAAAQQAKSFKTENEQLKEQTLCKICLDQTVCIVFLPCGHLVTCADCAPAMRKCPICRALVRGTVRTYMS